MTMKPGPHNPLRASEKFHRDTAGSVDAQDSPDGQHPSSGDSRRSPGEDMLHHPGRERGQPTLSPVPESPAPEVAELPEQWVTCDGRRDPHGYSSACRGVVRSVPAPEEPCPSCGAPLVPGEFEAAGCGKCGAQSPTLTPAPHGGTIGRPWIPTAGCGCEQCIRARAATVPEQAPAPPEIGTDDDLRALLARHLKLSREQKCEQVAIPYWAAEAIISSLTAASETPAGAGHFGTHPPFTGLLLPAASEMNQALQLAARELPHGFQVHISIERGAGWVRLNYPGAPFEYSPDGAGMTLSEQILECVEKAKKTPVTGE